MVNRIIVWSILPLCFLALFLALNGVHRIGYGDTYMNFIRDLSRLYNGWSFEIPDIPLLNRFDKGNYDSSGLILRVLINIANFFVGYLNLFIRTINIFTTMVNVFIKMVGFFISLIRAVGNFIKTTSQQVVFIRF